MLRKLLPHAAIILSGMYVVFFFLDRVNAAIINSGKLMKPRRITINLAPADQKQEAASVSQEVNLNEQ